MDGKMRLGTTGWGLRSFGLTVCRMSGVITVVGAECGAATTGSFSNVSLMPSYSLSGTAVELDIL